MAGYWRFRRKASSHQRGGHGATVAGYDVTLTNCGNRRLFKPREWTAGDFITGRRFINRVGTVACLFPDAPVQEVRHRRLGIRPRYPRVLFNGVDAPLRRAVVGAGASGHDEVSDSRIKTSGCRATECPAIDGEEALCFGGHAAPRSLSAIAARQV